MARTWSMTRNQRNDASSSRKRPKSSCAPWSDLDHDILCLVMMKLGFEDYYSFRGVCKSWRSFAHENQKKFMGSRPPMSITINCHGHEKSCYLEDFEKRRFKPILPHSPVAACVGLTCGYLIFFVEKTHSFWLVNPITRKELHFLEFPFDYPPYSLNKAILVFSPSISEMVFVVLHNGLIWFSIEGRGAWNCVYHSFEIHDLYAFKGKIYALDCDLLYVVGLHPQPKLTLKMSGFPYRRSEFVRSSEKLYAIPWDHIFNVNLNGLYEIDLGEKKWVMQCEKTLLGEYAFFHSGIQHGFVTVKRGSWSRSYDGDGVHRVFAPNMWYFPHQCMDVDCIDE